MSVLIGLGSVFWMASLWPVKLGWALRDMCPWTLRSFWRETVAPTSGNWFQCSLRNVQFFHSTFVSEKCCLPYISKRRWISVDFFPLGIALDILNNFVVPRTTQGGLKIRTIKSRLFWRFSQNFSWKKFESRPRYIVTANLWPVGKKAKCYVVLIYTILHYWF